MIALGKTLTCKKCGTDGFRDAVALREHANGCTGVKLAIKEAPLTVKVTEELFNCHQCGRKNFTKRGLDTHACKPAITEEDDLKGVSAHNAPLARIMRKTDELKPHELLERVMMMRDVTSHLAGLKVKKDEHKNKELELREDHDSFYASLDEVGIQDALKVTPSGKIADGRHRWDWAVLRGIKEVPTVIVSEEEAIKIIETMLIARRYMSKSMKAYVAVLMHPEVVEKGRGKPNSAQNAELTADSLAIKYGVSVRLIEQAIELYKSFEQSKKLKADMEWRIFAGFGLGGLLAGNGGSIQKGVGIQGENYARGLLVQFSKFGGSISERWQKITNEDDRHTVTDGAITFIKKLPEEIRASIRAELLEEEAAK
jgi:hypothetical protein